MSGVKVKDGSLAKFNESVQGWFSRVRTAAEGAAVGLGKEAFEQILETSPQYSGDFTANWKVSVGTPDTTFTIDVIPSRVSSPDDDGIRHSEPFKRGDGEAIAYAKSRAKWPVLKLGQKLFISNSANHDEPYAMKIENGEIKLRPVNKGADHVVRRSTQYVLNRYSRIDKVQLQALLKGK